MDDGAIRSPRNRVRVTLPGGSCRRCSRLEDIAVVVVLSVVRRERSHAGRDRTAAALARWVGVSAVRRRWLFTRFGGGSGILCYGRDCRLSDRVRLGERTRRVGLVW